MLAHTPVIIIFLVFILLFIAAALLGRWGGD